MEIFSVAIRVSGLDTTYKCLTRKTNTTDVSLTEWAVLKWN